MEMREIFFLSLGLLTTPGWSSAIPKIGNDHIAIEDCGRSIYEYARDTNDRIIGGRYAKLGEYPWMVTLRERVSLGFRHVCGGTIISERYVITAAHCLVSTSTRDYDVVSGIQKLSDIHSSPTATIHNLSKIILHDGFDPATSVNDIALLKTVTPIDFKASKGNVTGVCLPEPGSDPKGQATVTGWGHTVEHGENSDTLKTVDVPLIPHKTCNDRYSENPFDNIDNITETMICAGSEGSDLCQNDSGGPLVQYGDNGRATLIGVVSFGAVCREKYFPAVYTRVSAFLNWIEDNAD